MACQNCKPETPITVFPLPSGPCGPLDAQPCCEQPTDATCVEYTSTPLSCLGGTEIQKLDEILQRIDIRICELTGGTDPYGDFELLCLEPVTTARDFAERTAAMLCQVRTTLLNFINNLYPVDLMAIKAEITDLNKAGFDKSCSGLNIVRADTISMVLSKLAEAICALELTTSDLSQVDWDKCVTISQAPSSIQEGFNFILQQLCTLQDAGTSTHLPSFDNTGSCLAAPSITDSLQETIMKIRSHLCSLPTFSVTALPNTCVSLSGITTLEQSLSKILTQLDNLSRNSIRQVDNSQFSIADADATQPCQGKRLVLTGTVQGTDRMVAVNAADTVPGTLEQKISAGTGIAVDANAVPGKLTITTTQIIDYRVKTHETDSTPGYLSQKMIGAPGEVNVTVTPVTDQLEVRASIDYSIVIDRLFDILETDADLKARFCALVASCPSPCTPPTNVEAIAVP